MILVRTNSSVTTILSSKQLVIFCIDFVNISVGTKMWGNKTYATENFIIYFSRLTTLGQSCISAATEESYVSTPLYKQVSFLLSGTVKVRLSRKKK